MQYHFRYHADVRGGYWAECIELEGCRTEGDSLQELEANANEALNLYIDEPVDSKAIFPDPGNIADNENIIKIRVDPKIALAQQLRMFRIKNGMTQSEVAHKLGYKSIWAYQKLEKHKGSPNLRTLAKLKRIFPDLDLNLLF